MTRQDDEMISMRHAQREQVLQRQARFEARADTHLRCSLRMAAAQERIADALERAHPPKPTKKARRG